MVLPGNRIDGDTIDSHNLLPPGLSELRRNANKETFMFLWMPIFPAAMEAFRISVVKRVFLSKPHSVVCSRFLCV